MDGPVTKGCMERALAAKALMCCEETLNKYLAEHEEGSSLRVRLTCTVAERIGVCVGLVVLDCWVGWDICAMCVD